MKYHWSQTDRQLLVQLVTQSRQHSNRICWDSVSKHFPDRSKQQLKSYYFSITKNLVDEGQKPVQMASSQHESTMEDIWGSQQVKSEYEVRDRITFGNLINEVLGLL